MVENFIRIIISYNDLDLLLLLIFEMYTSSNQTSCLDFVKQTLP